MVSFEGAMVVSYRLSIVTIVISPTNLAAICRRMSPTLKSTVMGHFGAKFGEEGVTNVSPTQT